MYSRYIQGRSSTGIFSLFNTIAPPPPTEDGSGLTSAVVLVTVVRAVLASVTSPAGRDAHIVVTLEPRGWTLGHQSFYRGHTETETSLISIKLYLHRCVFLFLYRLD